MTQPQLRDQKWHRHTKELKQMRNLSRPIPNQTILRTDRGIESSSAKQNWRKSVILQDKTIGIARYRRKTIQKFRKEGGKGGALTVGCGFGLDRLRS